MRGYSKLLRIAGILGVLVLLTVLVVSPVKAESLPDDEPTIEDIWCYRNVLETGDFLIIFQENTPYATPPDTPYSQAFVWRWMENDGVTEIAQATGFDYNDNGYGYNIVSFYLDASEAPPWNPASVYKLRLSGTPAAFGTEVQYNYNIETSSYSSLTDNSAVQADIALLLIQQAQEFNGLWGLLPDYYLDSQSDVSTVLSLYGQAFFRGAIYGVQAMAPDAFPLAVTDIDTTERSWSTTYVTLLRDQYAGTYLEDAMAVGNSYLDVSYNLFGMLLIGGVCLTVIFCNWYLAGGNLWRGLLDATPPLIIGARLALFGLGEVALIAGVAWLYVSAKIWKIV